MRSAPVTLSVFLLALLTPSTSSAQLRRREPPPGEGVRVPSPVPLADAPSNPRFPYAGAWQGVRSMPVGSDPLELRFTVENGGYLGQLVHADGGATPKRTVTSGAAGISWEMPNSGGGTWLYRMRLVAPDSIAGTLELLNAPPELQPAPRGSIGARRVAARR